MPLRNLEGTTVVLFFLKNREQSLSVASKIWKFFMKLSAIIEDKAVKESIVEDCTQLIDAQVKAKSGLSGLALKTAYNVVKGLGASYIPGAIGRLLPEVLEALDPLWKEGVQAGKPVEHLIDHRSQTADMVLKVTDERAQRTNNVVRSSYNKLRKSVKGDVEEAVPGIARIIAAHAQPMQQAL